MTLSVQTPDPTAGGQGRQGGGFRRRPAGHALVR